MVARTEQAGLALLKAYQQEVAGRATRPPERAAREAGTPAPAPEDGGEAERRVSRELGKGKLLDIYG